MFKTGAPVEVEVSVTEGRVDHEVTYNATTGETTVCVKVSDDAGGTVEIEYSGSGVDGDAIQIPVTN